MALTTGEHWWNVPLYVNSRGLTTSLIPYRNAAFEIWFDFIDHQLVLQMSDGSHNSCDGAYEPCCSLPGIHG